MWLRPSPFRDPGPTANPRVELGGGADRGMAGYSGVTTTLDLGKSKAEVLRTERDPTILAKLQRSEAEHYLCSSCSTGPTRFGGHKIPGYDGR